MTNKTTDTSIHKPHALLSVHEFAERLNLKPATIRRWILLRRISYCKLGSRAVRIPVSEAERVIHEGLRPAIKER